MKKFTVAILAIALVALGSIFVFAQTGDNGRKGKRGFGGKHGKRGFMKGRMLKQLDLSDAQKEKIQGIMKSSRESTKALRQQMRENKKQLFDLQDGSFNESQVKAIAEKQGNLHAQLIVAKTKTKSEIFAVLTPEQKAKASELKEQFKKKMQERKQKRAERMKNM